MFRTRPDLIVRDGARTVALIDAEWKQLANDPLNHPAGVAQADVYQLMTSPGLSLQPLMSTVSDSVWRGWRDRAQLGLAYGREQLNVATIDLPPVARAFFGGFRDLNLGACQVITWSCTD